MSRTNKKPRIAMGEPDTVNDAFIIEQGSWRPNELIIEGKFIANGTNEELLEELGYWTEKNQYWPTLWIQDERGYTEEVDYEGNVVEQVGEDEISVMDEYDDAITDEMAMELEADEMGRYSSTRVGRKVRPHKYTVMIYADDPAMLPTSDTLGDYLEHHYFDFAVESVEMVDPDTVKIDGVITNDWRARGKDPRLTNDALQDMFVDVLTDEGFDTENMMITVGPHGHRMDIPRGASTRTAKKEEREPGQVSGALRRRMGDALADIFDTFGPKIFSEVVIGLEKVIVNEVSAGFDELDGTIQTELGKRGVEESREHIKSWADELVADVNSAALKQAGEALSSFVDTLTAEFIQEDTGEGEMDLLDVPEGLEEVEEEEVEEVLDDEEAEKEDESPDAAITEVDEEGIIDLGDLGLDTEEEAAASFGPTGGRRRRPKRRPVRRRAATKRVNADVVDDLTHFVEAEMEDKLRRAIEAASHPRDAAHKLKGIVINAAKQLSDDWQQMFPPETIVDAAEKLLADHT